VFGPGDDVLLEIGRYQLEFLGKTGYTDWNIPVAFWVLLRLAKFYDGDHIELELTDAHR
jgi:hypothetical protein